MTEPVPTQSGTDRLRASILARILFLIDTNRDLFDPPIPPEPSPEPSERELALWRAIRMLVEDRWPELKEHQDG